jgi:hypothetical protein
MRVGRSSWRLGVVVFMGLLASAALSQDKKQDIPDAPSAVRPPQPLPTLPPAQEQPAEPPPAQPKTPPGDLDPTAPIPFNIKTVPEGGATPDKPMATTDDLYRIVRNVNQVMVPVMVKDQSGKLVSGLTSKDFKVLENGTNQVMNYFTSDPFPLSAAVIFDFSMSDTAIQKVNRTFSALQGAFSQFDEIALYTYGSSVSQATDFNAVGSRLNAALNDLKQVRGRNNGRRSMGYRPRPERRSRQRLPAKHMFSTTQCWKRPLTWGNATRPAARSFSSSAKAASCAATQATATCSRSS